MKNIFLTIVTLSGLVFNAHSDPITIVNQDFELPGGTGELGWDVVDGWTESIPGGGAASGTSDTWSTLPPFNVRSAVLSNQDIGVYQTTSYMMTGSDLVTVSFDTVAIYTSISLDVTLYYEEVGGNRVPLETKQATDQLLLQWNGQSLEYTIDAPAANGLPLGIEFANIAGGGQQNVYFDNVAVSAIPEPGTLMLALLGMVAVIGVRRARR